MVAVSRRTSARQQRIEPKEQDKAQKSKRKSRKDTSESPPAKRQKKSHGLFDFDSDENENETIATTDHGSVRKSSRTSVESEKKRESRLMANGDTPTRPSSNGVSKKRKREKSVSPVPSDTSSDPLSSAKYPASPAKRLSTPRKTNLLTPMKSTPSKKLGVVNGIATPTGRTPTKPFNQRLEELTSSKPAKTTPLSQKITVNGTRQKSASKVIPPLVEELDLVKSEVLSKLCGRTLVPLIGKPAEVADEIHTVMSRAVQGESNTLLLLGGPGSSKSVIVNTALHKLKETHPDAGSYYTIRLDGQIQTDDKIALREIARQLALEMNVEMEKLSFADTLTTLLYTLSHPSEFSSEVSTTTTSASVIFVLDSFDLFLTHPRQALLYNLFDIAQSRKAPIAVICLGRQVNAMDGLEKRVKSRFGGRILQVGRPKTKAEFWKVCKAALSVEESGTFTQVWNRHIEGLGKEDAIQDICEEIFVQSRDVREFFNRSIPVITSLDHTTFLPPADSWSTNNLSPAESKLSLLEGRPQTIKLRIGLSQLELALLISATRLETFHALESFNFPMVYEIYSTLVARSRTTTITALGEFSLPGSAIQLWGRDVAFRAWEKLGEIGLWSYVSLNGEGRGRFVRCEVGLLEVLGVCERLRLLSSSMKSWFKENI